MENSLYLGDALEIMRKLDENKTPIPFDLKIRTFNKQNKSAGREVVYEKCELMHSSKHRRFNKNPNHWENKTRNVKLPSGEIKKINILFIIELNGKKVLY